MPRGGGTITGCVSLSLPIPHLDFFHSKISRLAPIISGMVVIVGYLSEPGVATYHQNIVTKQQQLEAIIMALTTTQLFVAPTAANSVRSKCDFDCALLGLSASLRARR